MKCLKQKKQSKQKTNICKICFNPIENNSIHSLMNDNVSICHKCYKKFKPVLKKFKVDEIHCLSLYNYDDEVKEKLYQLKGCFDYELSPIFIEYLKLYFKIRYMNYVLVPAPSYIEKDKERGFNHVQEIFKSINHKMILCFEKIDDIKQADLSAENRKNVINNLVINNGALLTGKKVLIVDDVYTTGSTIKAMIKLMKPFKPKKIKVLVMSKTLSPHEPVN
ncbi:MAG: ComF family protein [Bacilli bacterium]|nr:ComF family protein [Bacilli bacterium]